ncbi:MAG: LLM class flavin-dependent oxidoreductase [Actinobacteria bacterium]|nr:MAG: LLM class flavin-dependent oxidoreductase [Actinomycetota bacterium]
MELGLTSFADVRQDPKTGETIGHGERLRNVVDEIVKAEEVGLDAYGLGEHHRIDMAASAPAITLAAAAARTERIRLGSAVIVLSSADPVRTFQDFATLDLISKGRAELMVGRGSFIESFPLFGYSLDDYNELFVEKLELLLAIRDNEIVEWSGRFRAPIRGQGVYPRPFQDPLPIQVGVGGTPASVVRAATLGLPIVLAIIGGQPARFRALVDLYRQTLVENDYDPAEFPIAVHGHGYVADDDDQAAEEVYPSYAAMMSKIGRERGWPPMTREQYDWMRGPDGSLVLGDPETVAGKIMRWQEWLDIERFMLHNPAQLSHDRNLRSIELLGKEVSPLVRGS